MRSNRPEDKPATLAQIQLGKILGLDFSKATCREASLALDRKKDQEYQKKAATDLADRERLILERGFAAGVAVRSLGTGQVALIRRITTNFYVMLEGKSGCFHPQSFILSPE